MEIKEPDEAVKLQEHWETEVMGAERYFKDYWSRCEAIEKTYRDEGKSRGNTRVGTRFNIFWSNIKTLEPSLYIQPPKPVVERTFLDADPIGRVASETLERALKNGTAGRDKPFDAMMREARTDYLLYARGIAWVRGEYEMGMVEQEVEGVDELGQPVMVMQQTEAVISAKAVPEFVGYRDFMHNPCRTWSEVKWAAKAAYMGKKELEKRFGDAAKDVPLNFTPDVLKDLEDKKISKKKQAQVWEIWCKVSNKVYWFVKGNSKILDAQDPPIKFDGFFPCPKPAFGTLTNSTLIPVPDYVEYQDQAEEINLLTKRIHYITKAIKANGVYNGAQKEISRIFDESKENELVPVADWNGFTANGGTNGQMDFVPVEGFVKVLAALVTARQQAKADLYEISGISDIMRGNSDSRETAKAQSIKANFGSLRIQDRQYEIQRFARDVVALMAEVIAETFPPDILAAQAGVKYADDPAMMPVFDKAVELLRDGVLRNFRIDIETDSTIALDKAEAKASANELLGVVSNMFKESIPLVQSAPEMLPVVKELILLTLRAYEGGRQLETVIEEAFKQVAAGIEAAKQQPPAPDPKMVEAESKVAVNQSQAQKNTVDAQATIAKTQMEMARTAQGVAVDRVQ